VIAALVERLARSVRGRAQLARLRAATAGVLLLTLVEAPLFLFRNRRSIFRNDMVCVFWHWSFGHTASGLDYLARLYHPHRVSVVYVPHPRSNPTLARCFGHSLDVVEYRSLARPRLGPRDWPKERFLRSLLLILSAVRPRIHVIEWHDAYGTLSVAGGGLLVCHEETGRTVPITDYTGWLRLLELGIGPRPSLPSDEEAAARRALQRDMPEFLERPFAALLLREKGSGEAFDSAFRSAGPHEGYRSAVELLSARGYNIAGTGETRHEAFAGVAGYFSLADVSCDPQLLNLFLITRCSLFVGQQSGPSVLANACGIPAVLCDALPHRLGTYRREDLVLFKHLRDSRTGERLTLSEIYRERPGLALGCGFGAGGIQIEPNTPEEITGAVAEAIDLLEGRLQLTDEDNRLWRRFLELVPAEMTLHHQGNRPPLSVLRTLGDASVEGALAQARRK
jgi:putative glycosyltransferase (TIGR04372 family)